MLPDEIDPFATAHIEALESVRELLKNLNYLFTEPVEGIDEARAKLLQAQHGFTRFKVCMADEVQQKQLYRNRWMELRFEKS